MYHPESRCYQSTNINLQSSGSSNHFGSLVTPCVYHPVINMLSIISSQSPINLQSTSHSRQLNTTGKEQDASGQEGWPPLHLLFLDKLAVFAFIYFLHDRTPVCNFFGVSRISWRCRHHCVAFLDMSFLSLRHSALFLPISSMTNV